MQEAIESLKKSLKDYEQRYKELQDKYLEASKVAVLQGQLLDLEKKKGTELAAQLEEEKGKAIKLSTLSKTLAKQRADLSAQVQAYSTACAKAGLSVELDSPTGLGVTSPAPAAAGERAHAQDDLETPPTNTP